MFARRPSRADRSNRAGDTTAGLSLPPVQLPVPAPAALPRAGEVVAGYRLVRKLGEGSRAEVFLGVGLATVSGSGTEPADAALALAGRSEPATPGMPPDAPVALKIFRPHLRPADVDSEAGALARVRHPHALQLLDIERVPGRSPVLITERVAGPTLASILATRSDLLAGEAITMLAPLASAVASLHTAGVVHGSIGVPRIIFRSTGAPVLCGFSRAQLFDGPRTPAGLSADGRVTADRRAIARLGLLVIERVRGHALDELRDWIHAQAEAPGDEFLLQFESALFDAALAEPVQFTTAGTSHAVAGVIRFAGDDSPDSGMVPTPEPRGWFDPRGRASGRAGGSASGSAVGSAAWRTVLGRTHRSAPEAISAGLAVIREHLRTVRRPVWVVAGLVAALVVATVVVVPVLDRSGPGGSVETPVVESGQHSPAPSASADPKPTNGAMDGDSAIEGDDPVAAARALLARRNACFRQLSVLCLDDVDQFGSEALASDTEMVRLVQAGGELKDSTISTGTVTVIEELGDSVLIDLGVASSAKSGTAGHSKPASLLVMRSEAGWRIRDYLEE